MFPCIGAGHCLYKTELSTGSWATEERMNIYFKSTAVNAMVLIRL